MRRLQNGLVAALGMLAWTSLGLTTRANTHLKHD